MSLWWVCLMAYASVLVSKTEYRFCGALNAKSNGRWQHLIVRGLTEVSEVGIDHHSAEDVTKKAFQCNG